ncbi:PepSY domain-containing protein [Congregibacter litoralis]|nr:PepSY domain-containing protein [Congregibacter litoralis]
MAPLALHHIDVAMRKSKHFYVRKAHRWISIFVGVQLLMWTASGLYFSWTDIDEIHGDQFLAPGAQSTALRDLRFPDLDMEVSGLGLRFIDNRAHLWINGAVLIDPANGTVKPGVSKDEAEGIARRHIKDEYHLVSSTLLTEAGRHHEYRGRPLPAWVITFAGPTTLTAYVSQRDGSFQRVRHRSWRIFDFLWMLHTMDYQGRDDFNNAVLRAFSLFALSVVLTGFILFFVSRANRNAQKLKAGR